MKRLHNESCLLVVLLHAIIALALVLTSGCGNSRFLEYPTGEPPDTSDCSEVKREFGSTMPWTPIPFPFDGKKKLAMSTWVPDHWGQFTGQVYLMEASWDVGWVDFLKMALGDFPFVAVWDGRRWDVEPRIDLKPFLEVEDDRLRIKPFITASGVKPAGRPRVAVSVRVALCGPGHELIE